MRTAQLRFRLEAACQMIRRPTVARRATPQSVMWPVHHIGLYALVKQKGKSSGNHRESQVKIRLDAEALKTGRLWPARHVSGFIAMELGSMELQ